mmetsp:Transcript_38875/g.44375  ORF Transcript_38875/g.44375 Transcript_38875/m.44375 type:complete len:154 (+) Transcript_38875:281-742(+)|eukprot:CAMPEP_0194130580 /NCGR_PEP_ID=MMETSP0152-20130528/1602_1 /TAXON_ID=1049557 /ORGANISM="Thalassiothrix antarctica, Strain L6-D1" /LENGTH=153 /DNA_ID=CAMNT_0038825149 /DNA_START=317 /DNA_END=778 /DNA_ORIENTATION=+
MYSSQSLQQKVFSDDTITSFINDQLSSSSSIGTIKEVQRFLDDIGTNIDPVDGGDNVVPAEVPVNAAQAAAPTIAPSAIATKENDGLLSLSSQEKAGFVVLFLGLVVALIGIYYCISYIKRKRERRMLQLVNTKVDDVLGDMAMVPSDNDGLL